MFPTTEIRHRDKLLTNKYSCIFYEKSYIFASSSKSGGFETCSLLCASVKLQKPANVSCNSQYLILAVNHCHFCVFFGVAEFIHRVMWKFKYELQKLEYLYWVSEAKAHHEAVLPAAFFLS